MLRKKTTPHQIHTFYLGHGEKAEIEMAIFHSTQLIDISNMLITEFYENREVFITGATGFLGKALIEKLLRDCPKVKVLYTLIRSKRSVSAENRLEELKNSKVFDRIRNECPQVLSKLHAICGDSEELGLGIKEKDLELLQNVSVIFHMSANVKFDVPLRSSILINTRGTYELVKIAEKLKNLVVFLHCSTAYCNPLRDPVEEKVYKTSFDWRTTIKMAEKFDDYTINVFSKKYIDYFPNSYTFTKNLSEQIISEYSSKLPMLILRPSVVMSALNEPVAGWVDNMNGPIALFIGIAAGVLPKCHVNPDIQLDAIPIDLVTKITIVAAYKRGMQKIRNETIPNDLEVINCAAAGLANVTNGQAVSLLLSAIKNNPLENCIWKFDMPALTVYYYHFLLYIFLINIPAALLVDSLLILMGKDPMLMKISRKVVYSVKAVQPFVSKSYNMNNQNLFNLEKYIPDCEFKTFGCLEEALNADYYKYFESILCGFKENILNQPSAASESAKLRYKIFHILNKTVKSIIFILIIRYLWFKLNF